MPFYLEKMDVGGDIQMFRVLRVVRLTRVSALQLIFEPFLMEVERFFYTTTFRLSVFRQRLEEHL